MATPQSWDLISQLPSIETPTPPPQLDYRANPSLGQTPLLQEPGQNSRDNPIDRGLAMPPQKMLGHLGYSLNPIEATPNQMTDQNPALSFGNVPDAGYGQGPSIGAYDFYGNSS